MKLIPANCFLIALLLTACGYDKNYDPNARLNSKEKAAIISSIVRYTSKPPENAVGDEKFNAKYDTFYREKASKIIFEQYVPKGDDFYFLISQPAPSLVEKRNATGGRFRLNDRGEMTEYEEIFRTWKMVPDTLRRRSYFLFDKMVQGEDLTKFETHNSNGVDYIEFPDERTYYDTASRSWKLK